MKYLQSYNESIKDYLKPKPKEEILKKLGGREDAVFKPTDKLLKMSYFIGTYETSYENLVKIFGKPNSEGDFDKVSTEWNLEDDKGNLVNISDYKMTNLYDLEYPSVQDFREEPSYNWRIFSDNKEILKDIWTFLYLKTLSLNESIKNFLKPKSKEEILNSLNKLTPYEKVKKIMNYKKYSKGELVSDDMLNEFMKQMTLKEKLIFGCVNNIIWLVKLALEEGVDPSSTNNVAITICDQKCNMDILELLLNDSRVKSKLTEETIKEYKQRISISKLFKNKQNESITQYLKPKSEENIIKSAKHLPPNRKLLMGCEFGIFKLVKLGLEEGGNPKINGNSPLRTASSHGHVDIVKLLLKTDGVIPNIFDNTPIILASQYGHYDVVKSLLEDERVDPSDQDNNAIVFADRFDFCDIVKLLLQDERVREKISKKRLEYYIKRSEKTLNESIMDFLKPKSEEDIENSVKHLTPDEKILKGCENNLLWLVKRGIDDGGDPNVRESGKYNKDSALRIAVECGSIDVVKFLIKLPEIEPVDEGNSIIWSAVYEERIEIIRILLDNDMVLRKTVLDGDIDHFIELVDDFDNDQEWIDYISKRIDKLKNK